MEIRKHGCIKKLGSLQEKKIQNTEYKGDLQFSTEKVEDGGHQIGNSLINSFFMAMQLLPEEQTAVGRKGPHLSFLSVLQTRKPPHGNEKIFRPEAASLPPRLQTSRPRVRRLWEERARGGREH